MLPTGVSDASCSVLSTLKPFLEVGKWSTISESLYVDSISLDLSFLFQLIESGHNMLGESELTGNEHLLSSWELELGSSEGFSGVVDLEWSGTDGDKDGSDVDTSRLAKSLSVSVSHTSLESISTGTGKHFVNTDDVPWVDSDSNMETKFTSVVLHEFVSGNTSCLKCLRGDLLLLVGNKMDAAWELIPMGLSLSSVVNTNLWVWHSTIEARLWIWLIFLVSVATRWSSSHFYKIITNLCTNLPQPNLNALLIFDNPSNQFI